jgi:hypothetical protein
MTGKAAAIVRSGPMRTAISPSIAKRAKSSKLKASPCRRTSLEEASSDRPLHPELLRGAWPRAANLVADQTISGRNPKLRYGVLELISSSEGQVEIRVGEARSGLTPAVVAPLAISQLR